MNEVDTSGYLSGQMDLIAYGSYKLPERHNKVTACDTASL